MTTTTLPLSLACWDYDRTRPLIDGRVRADGIDLSIQLMRPREAFVRMLERQEFHASEISLASYMALQARGDCPFVAIPVMLSKMFRHSCIYVHRDAGIKTPADLKGKRVGATQFASTGLVFMKGMLQHDYDVAPTDMSWFIGGLDQPAHRTATTPPAPPDTTIEYVFDRSLEDMFEASMLDALFALYIPKIFEHGSPSVGRLFPNFKAVEQDYFRRTRIYPIMHTVVIRADVHRDHPWVARSLYRAFCEARDLAIGGLYDTDALRVGLPWLIDHIEESRRVLGADFFSYGLEPNRATLAALAGYMFEQKLAPRVVTPEELFVAGLS
jgi:4,5-dihydroxyphthalate decarboxylase